MIGGTAYSIGKKTHFIELPESTNESLRYTELKYFRQVPVLESALAC